jgi:hypothetical protein
MNKPDSLVPFQPDADGYIVTASHVHVTENPVIFVDGEAPLPLLASVAHARAHRLAELLELMTKAGTSGGDAIELYDIAEQLLPFAQEVEMLTEIVDRRATRLARSETQDGADPSLPTPEGGPGSTAGKGGGDE